MICLHNQPYSIVENTGFCHLLQTICPQYNIPSRNYFRDNIIPDIYNRVYEKIKTNLKESKCISLTSDIWTCKNTNISFLTITGHWITNAWKKENVVLSCSSFQGSHTAVSDMIAGAKRIATHFNHSSLACGKMKQIQQEYGLPNKKIIQDVPTRWNSTYYMLERMQELRSCITVYCAETSENLNFSNLTSNQWELLRSTLKVVRPFEEITKTISSTESIISDVIPILTTLRKFLTSNSALYGIGTTKQTLLENLTRRFANIETNKHYVTATVLDPRYKIAFFSTNVCEIKRIILKELQKTFTTNVQVQSLNRESNYVVGEKQYSSSSDSDNEDEPLFKIAKREESLWTCFDSIASTSRVNLKVDTPIIDQLEKYLEEPLQERLSNPIDWWKEHEFRFPDLAKNARRYLSAPASSVYSERSFSEIGNVYEEKRSRLTPQNAEKLLFIHHNLAKINFDY